MSSGHAGIGGHAGVQAPSGLRRPTNLTVLETRPSRRAEAVVELLEGLLASAISGEFECVAVALVRPDGNATTVYTGTDYVPARLGAVTVLQSRLALAALDE